MSAMTFKEKKNEEFKYAPRLLDVSGHKINAFDSSWQKEYGKATPTIVLIHGVRGTLNMWEDQASELAKKYRVITYEFSGHGESENVKYSSLDDYVKELKGLLDSLKVQNNVFIVGYSWGGDIAHAFAREYAVRGTLLVGVIPTASKSEAVWDNARFAGTEMFKKEAAPPKEYDLTRLPGMRSVISSWSTKSFGEQKDGSPALILNGEKDRMTTPNEAAKLAELIPKSEFHVIKGRYHNIFWDKEFYKYLEDFIEKNRTP